MKRRERGQGGLIRYKNSAVWYGQYYDSHGRQVRRSTGETVKQRAQAVLQGWMSDSARGLKPEPETRNVSYEDLREALIENYREKGNRSLQVFSDGSEGIFPLTKLDEFFTGKRASQIDSTMVSAFIRKRQADGVGNAAINNSLALLRRMFSLAVIQRKLQAAPHIQLLKRPTARKGFLEAADFARLRDALPAHLRPLILFLYYCGVRVGEARQIKWSQVDLDRAMIVIHEEQAKNSEPRVIPLPNEVLRMLRAEKNKDGTVFDATGLRSAWTAATKACGLDGLLIHDLRRSAIRNLMLAGAQQAEAMAISGHKTADVFRRYNIVSPEQTVNVMKRLQRHLAGQLRATNPRSARGRKALSSGRKSNEFGESLVRAPKAQARK